jgi:hypothetical protein
MSQNYEPSDKQTGTGTSASGDLDASPLEPSTTAGDQVDPGIVVGAETRADPSTLEAPPNRSGSGGSGGSRGEGADTEGSTGETNEELLDR